MKPELTKEEIITLRKGLSALYLDYSVWHNELDKKLKHYLQIISEVKK